MRIAIVLCAVFTAMAVFGDGALAAPKWAAPLAHGGAPPCPKHPGTRKFRSETVAAGDMQAVISGRTRRESSGCERDVEIEVETAHNHKAFSLPTDGGQSFSIIDFSPDASEFLVARDTSRDYPNELWRNVSIAIVPLSTGKIQWMNVWDLLEWKDCDATVEPQGFTGTGEPVLRVRPSVMRPRRRQDCIDHDALYQVDLKRGLAIQAPNAFRPTRYGKVVEPAFQACRSDPDVVGACFSVYGRLSLWNGAPTARIWRIGTKRILGIDDGFPPPKSLASRLDFGTQAYGDFLVCPLTPNKPGHMQRVCVESARKLRFQQP